MTADNEQPKTRTYGESWRKAAGQGAQECPHGEPRGPGYCANCRRVAPRPPIRYPGATTGMDLTDALTRLGQDRTQVAALTTRQRLELLRDLTTPPVPRQRQPDHDRATPNPQLGTTP